MDYSALARLLSLLSVLLCIIVFVILRRKRKILAQRIVFLAMLCLLASVGSRMIFDGPWIPLTLLRDVLAVTIALLVGAHFFPTVISSVAVKNSTDYSKPEILQQSVSQILDSQSFLTALRSTLPRGEADKEFGLDYIPFMLDSIDARRRRAIKSARLFLFATVTSAVIFSLVVMYFGYILVNEASAGTAKSLADIRTALESASTSVRVLIPAQNAEFEKNVAPLLKQLEGLAPGEKNKEAKERIVAAITEARTSGNFPLLYRAVRAIELSDIGVEERAYFDATKATLSAMYEFSFSQQAATTELSHRVDELKQLIPKAEETLNKPEHRVPEIIKRLALGLVIATFFLALLRYLGGLYKTRYSQVLSAEADDFAIRRFYVAFKGSANDEQRKISLSSLLSSTHTTNGDQISASSEDATKQQYEVLKELVAALAKKI